MSVISRSLQRVIEAATEGQTSMCITLESKANPDRWVQITWDAVNAAWPHAEEPAVKLHELGIAIAAPIEITGWEAGKYATFAHTARAVPQTAAFVAAYLRLVLGISDGEADLSVTEEEL